MSPLSEKLLLLKVDNVSIVRILFVKANNVTSVRKLNTVKADNVFTSGKRSERINQTPNLILFKKIITYICGICIPHIL